MDFIRYLWARAEFYAKVSIMSWVTFLVLFTLAQTYESKFLHFCSGFVAFGYIAYMMGYEIIYKSLKDKYNTFKKEQADLFNNIKEPK